METIKDVVCRNFNRLVDSSGLSPKVLAKMFEVSEPTFYRWKKGEHSPELPNIEIISRALNIDPFEFYRREVPLPVPKSFKIKDISSFLEAIPDDVYSYAQSFEHTDEVWKSVMVVLKDAIKDK